MVAKIGSAPVLPVGASADEDLACLAVQSDARFGWANLAARANDTTPDIVTLGSEADPALDPAPAQAHPAVGSTATVTATLRNLGRNTGDPDR